MSKNLNYLEVSKISKSSAAQTKIKHRINTVNYVPIKEPIESPTIREEFQKMLDKGSVQPVLVKEEK